jgi:rhamnosyltransferase
LNQGITEAVKDGHRLYFLFDQDTVVDESYLEAMICKYKSDTNTANTGYIVPNFFDRYSRTFAKFPILSKFQFYHADCANTAYRLEFNSGAVIAITSGMLIDYEKYKLIGDFKEEYFIDFIDNEYALRASTKGLKIRVCCNAIIDHSIGKRQIKNFLGLTVKPNHHHPVRRYFISRNGIRVAIEYKSIYPVFFALLILRMLHEILSIILFENSKSKKLQMIFKGLNNGLRGNMDHQIMIDRLNNSS